jgi:hypothetical protein
MVGSGSGGRSDVSRVSERFSMSDMDAGGKPAPKNAVEMTQEAAEALCIRQESGWTGHFTRQQAPGALFANGSRVIKLKTETGDRNPAGTGATVLGSIYHPALGMGYFVEWDDKPRTAVFVVGWKIGRRP